LLKNVEKYGIERDSPQLIFGRRPFAMFPAFPKNGQRYCREISKGSSFFDIGTAGSALSPVDGMAARPLSFPLEPFIRGSRDGNFCSVIHKKNPPDMKWTGAGFFLASSRYPQAMNSC